MVEANPTDGLLDFLEEEKTDFAAMRAMFED